MALKGKAALAMWWDMKPDMRSEFEHWHTHEHFPERLALPGFQRASRYGSADEGPGFFVLYELDRLDDLTSPEYLGRLDAPTDWSCRLMPHHANMVRSPSHVLASAGAATARFVATVRLAPAEDAAARLQAGITDQLPEFSARAGVAGAHLLRTERPAIRATRELAIRAGADRAADWIVVVCAYELAALDALLAAELSLAALAAAGAANDITAGRYQLSLTAARGDF